MLIIQDTFTSLEIAILFHIKNDNEYRLGLLKKHYPNYTQAFDNLFEKGYIQLLTELPRGRINRVDLTKKGYFLFQGV